MDVEFYRNALFNGGTKESFDTSLVLSLGWFWMQQRTSGIGHHDDEIFGREVERIRTIRKIYEPYGSMYEQVS